MPERYVKLHKELEKGSSMVERQFKSHFFYFVVLSVPFVIVEILLLIIYPNTGLGRILTLPITFMMNVVIILITSSVVYYLLKHTRFIVIGRVILCLSLCLTLLITVWLYPQDSSEHISRIIIEDIKKLWS